ncbi:hypothetical protein MKX03_007393, partial [Papaver bracteatum]
MSERSNQSQGIRHEASLCEALPTVEGDMNAPIDVECDSIIEISDGESRGSDDDLPPKNRLERSLS